MPHQITATLHVEERTGMPTRQTHSEHRAPSLTLGSKAPRGTGRHDRPNWVGLPERIIGPKQRPVSDNTQQTLT